MERFLKFRGSRPNYSVKVDRSVQTVGFHTPATLRPSPQGRLVSTLWVDLSEGLGGRVRPGPLRSGRCRAAQSEQDRDGLPHRLLQGAAFFELAAPRTIEK